MGARSEVGSSFMRALVTGGAGFLGSHLAEVLLHRGDHVEVLDDLSTGVRANVPPGASLLEGDIRDEELVEDAVGRADVVFHLAAAVGARVVAADPAGTWSRNVRGTGAVLDACARHGRRAILASSSEVYGPAGGGPLAESHPSVFHPTGRRDVYALSKAAGEAYALALHRTRLLPVTACRLFNVVGPRQSDRYGMVLPRFVRSVREGRPLGVYGDGSQRRCFLHVEDAVEALVALAPCAASEGEVLNVGSPREVTVLDLARLVIEEAGGQGEIEFIPFERVYGEGFVDPPRRVPDTRRIEGLIDFVPERTLRDAVRDLLLAGRSPA